MTDQQTTYDQLSALCAQLPDVADNKWTTPEGAKMAREYATRTRLDLAMMHLSDYELANAQYLCPRESFELGQYQTAAKERIRWLSVQLALQQLKSNALEALCAQMAAALEEVTRLSDRKHDAWNRAWDALTAYRTLSPDPQWQKQDIGLLADCYAGLMENYREVGGGWENPPEPADEYSYSIIPLLTAIQKAAGKNHDELMDLSVRARGEG